MPFRQAEALDVESLRMLGDYMAHRREVRGLRRQVPRVAAKQPVIRFVDGTTKYELEVRPGIKVQATLLESGERLASFTRNNGAGQAKVIANLHGRAARKVLADLRHGYFHPPAQQAGGRAVVALS
jgi:hypothetical protein